MKTVRRLWESIFFSIFKPSEPLAAGSFTYQTPPDAAEQYRLHLRVNPGGDGLLIVNASTVLHLNQTATEFAYHIVNKTPFAEASGLVSKRYHVTLMQAREDLQDLSERIETLIHQQDVDPITFLDFEEHDPYSADLSAPLRLDCALTYLTDGGIVPGLAPMDRVKTELTSINWMTMLDKAWQAGIPHVIFTGGEATLRPDLEDLIAYAEKIGMVAGLLTNGLRLADPAGLDRLLKAGLDHMMILLDPASETSWQAIQTAVEADIFLTVHLTVEHGDIENLRAILNKLSDLGVKNISLSAASADLHSELQVVRRSAAHLGMRLISDLPVPYSQFHPVALELDGTAELPRGSGSKWLYVEPDGDVLPGQGILQVMGNLLTDPWEIVWQNRPKG